VQCEGVEGGCDAQFVGEFEYAAISFAVVDDANQDHWGQCSLECELEGWKSRGGGDLIVYIAGSGGAPQGVGTHSQVAAAIIQHNKHRPDFSARAVEAVNLHDVDHSAAIDDGRAAVVLASPGEHPLIGFLPAGRQQILAGCLAWFRGRRTVCRGSSQSPPLPVGDTSAERAGVSSSVIRPPPLPIRAIIVSRFQSVVGWNRMLSVCSTPTCLTTIR